MTTAAATLKPIADTRASRGLWRDAFNRLLRNRPALLGLFLIAVFVAAALLAPVIAHEGPLAIFKDANGRTLTAKAPVPDHLMGTDKLGRDELARVVYGAQVSLYVGVVSVLMALVMGTFIGAVAGAFGGLVDSVLMRVVDVLLAVPGILLAIGIVTWLDRGLLQIMLAVAVTNVPIFARLLRGSLLALREAEFVTAARSMGASPVRLLVRHMLPNALTPLIVAATLALATAIIDVAGLGFLGLGPPDPRTAEWGTMLTDARQFLQAAPWLLFFPGFAISITAIGFNLLGDGLRESLDPRLKR